MKKCESEAPDCPYSRSGANIDTKTVHPSSAGRCGTAAFLMPALAIIKQALGCWLHDDLLDRCMASGTGREGARSAVAARVGKYGRSEHVVHHVVGRVHFSRERAAQIAFQRRKDVLGEDLSKGHGYCFGVLMN